MDFYAAIITCLKKYTTFSGRATRSEYWYFFLFTALGSAAFTFLDVGILNKNSDYDLLPLSAVFSLLVLIPSYTAACRRLHDLNYSGWWALAPIVAIALITFLLVFSTAALDKKNSGLETTIIFICLAGYLAVPAIWIWFFVQRGTIGPNRFGDDPLEIMPQAAQQSSNQPTINQPVIPDDPNACKKCGAHLMKNMRFCPSCGENR